MFVRFNTIEEFLAELATETPPGVLRVTIERRGSEKFAGALWYLSLVAGYVRADGMLVELLRYAGDLFSHDPEPKVLKLIDEWRKDLEAKAVALGWDIRAGRFLLSQE